MKAKQIFLWILVILWMTLIFCFSSQNSDESAELSGGFITTFFSTFMDNFDNLSSDEKNDIIESMQFFTRKSAHAFVYMVLAFLSSTALYSHKLKIKLVVPIAFGITVIYAITDEIHQLFVPGRAGRISDVIIDSTGGLIGLGVFVLLLMLIRHIKKMRK